MVNVYKVSCNAKGLVIYQVDLEEGDTEQDIVQFTKKKLYDDYSGFNLIGFEEPIIEHMKDKSYYVLNKVEISDNFYVSVDGNKDEDLLVKSIIKFKEKYPALTRITNFNYIMEEELGPDKNLEECFNLIEDHYNNK